MAPEPAVVGRRAFSRAPQKPASSSRSVNVSSLDGLRRFLTVSRQNGAEISVDDAGRSRPPNYAHPPTRAPVPRGQNGVTGRGEGRARCSYALKKVGACGAHAQIVGGKGGLRLCQCDGCRAQSGAPGVLCHQQPSGGWSRGGAAGRLGRRGAAEPGGSRGPHSWVVALPRLRIVVLNLTVVWTETRVPRAHLVHSPEEACP